MINSFEIQAYLYVSYTTPMTLPLKRNISVLLIDDQLIVAKALQEMLKHEPDMTLHYCKDVRSLEADLKRSSPSLILQDLMMPGVDGLKLVEKLKSDPSYKSIPLVVLSSKEEAEIKSQAFALGANDYLVKLPAALELIARIRYHANAYFNWLERNKAFARLQNELKEAAKYVQSILPAPVRIKDTLAVDWVYVPSAELGGDAFGYHWIDEDHFAMYLLDVCGHGVGAALLSVSAMNVLRSHSLPDVDFKDPVAVLKGLDKAFQMSEQNGMYFTIWYGIYSVKNHSLIYANGGHPPALLLQGDGPIHELTTEGLIIGTEFHLPFHSESIELKGEASLYLFSDGVFEVFAPQQKTMLGLGGLKGLIKEYEASAKGPHDILEAVQSFQGQLHFEDDFSLLKVHFIKNASL